MPTPTATYDDTKCAQRNRLAARRDGVEAVPVRFLPGEVSLAAASDQDPDRASFARGTLPQSKEDALRRINAQLQPGSRELSEQDVYLHFAEAVNDNFVRKYWFFLDASTLRNAAADAARGVAFMNSHRVGSLSHPSELPFGRTFTGRYEQHRGEDGTIVHRALIGLYMLKGVYPTGTAGPSTDDLSAMIEAGTVSDVSVGLVGGTGVCDLCGLDVDSDECEHVPGTTRNLSEEQIEAQRARAVPGGAASYTLVDAHIAEVSAVFKGAVPGAGFRKALAMERAGMLTRAEHDQVRGAYRALFATTEEIDMHEIEQVIEQASDSMAAKVLNGLRTFFSGNGSGGPPPAPATPATPEAPATPDAVPDAEPAEPGDADEAVEPEQEPDGDEESAEPDDTAPPAQLSVTDLQAQVRTLVGEKAQAFADALVRDGKLLPSGKAAVSASYARALADDLAYPEKLEFTDAAGNPQKCTRADALRLTLSALPPHKLTEELRVGKVEGAVVLTGGRDEETAKAEEAAEVDRVLATTPVGRAILAKRAEENGRNGHKK